MTSDLRYSLRALRLNPGFAAIAILSLALGVGANTAIFQLLDAVRLRSLPVEKPGQLAEIRTVGTEGKFIVNDFDSEMTFPLWDEFRRLQQPFSGTLATSNASFRVGRGAAAVRHDGIWAGGDYFAVLGVNAVRGRLLTAGDDVPGCAGSAVISYKFWQSGFDRSDAAIGRTLIIEGKPFSILGVTPPGFFGTQVGRSFDIALPLCAQALWGYPNGRDRFALTVMGRLKPGWDVARASAQLNSMSAGIFEATVPSGYPSTGLDAYRRMRLEAAPAAAGTSWLRETYDESLWLLLGITGLVLLIACANLANLLLARATARQRELAIRTALGAGRGRLIRQMLGESSVLAIAGAVVGAGLAAMLSRAVVWMLSASGDRIVLDLQPDWRVFGFTAALALLTCFTFGLLPAIRSSNADPVVAMKAGSRSSTATRESFGFQRFLAGAQIAVSFVLLFAAVLFVRSFHNLTSIDPGFRKQDLIELGVDFGNLHLPEARDELFQRELLERVRAVPGVVSAAATTHPPLNGSMFTLGVKDGGEDPWSRFIWISPQYFRTIGTRLLAGRDFTSSDRAQGASVAIVNQAFVRKFMARGNSIGRTFRSVAEPNYPATQYEIVGVTADTKYSDLRAEVPPCVFAPTAQFPKPGAGTQMLVRSAIPAGVLIPALRRSLAEVDPEINVDTDVLADEVAASLTRERLMATLAGFFGALAALLAVIGLYGVMAYRIARRRAEIGIRVALGATRERVLGLVLVDAGGMVGGGLLAGMVCALLAGRAAEHLLFGLKSNDVLTLVSTAGLLVGVALVATAIPASRATGMDPLNSLREE